MAVGDMTHDDGIRWLADELQKELAPKVRAARQNYLDAQHESEAEYFRGQRDGLDDVLDLVLKLRPAGLSL